ncbi:MAG: hypothetical protein WC618_03820 [Patescibacteria group bacterium]
MRNKKIKFRQSLFWDVNPKNIDVKKNAPYIIERVLDFGNDKEIKWLWNFYDKNLFKKVVRKSRNLMPQTKSLWSLMLRDK